MDKPTVKIPNMTRIFISYKTGVDDGLTYAANSLRRELDKLGYTVWMDEVSLEAGRDWNMQIYESIGESDILVMLLANTTVNSDWVRREIDVAKGSRVRILPVLIRENFDKQGSLDKFDLSRTQYVNLVTGSDDQFDKLIDAIKKLEGKTLGDQMRWLDERKEKNKGTAIKRPNSKYATFKLKVKEPETNESQKGNSQDSTSVNPPDAKSVSKAEKNKEGTEKTPSLNCLIHVAVGDITRMPNIDVLVNSENAYLQMARIFESKTVSALLRYYGSWVDEGGSLAEDTVQNELETVIRNNPRFTRPVGIGTVIATTAGHPYSILRTKNKARYIFHTVTVSVEGDGIERTLAPVKSDISIREAAIRTLEKIIVVNQADGVITPSGTGYAPPEGHKDSKDERARQEVEAKNKTYKPIESIIIPLYASGHGGRNAGEVMRPLVEGVNNFLEDIRAHQNDPDLRPTIENLKDIHLCVFHREYVETMCSVMSEFFEEVDPKTPRPSLD